ncbi:hypothetical protein LUZ63_015150 [Rhynchospora breviuscula]|uniref:Disease resistance protein At4g27190-like leucine-rich repeats domain-containing protein n=1 Tax=Rhynchospora breviuscula TaxID=2022672 RepID=A0A9Q0CC42_9POAL|nr:hypothetical protein LUZ63_015150 [Rhynchospora breviuscula]
MHDLIRDMAIWIANNQGEDTNKWIVHAGTYTESKEIQISSDTKALSLMNNGAKRILFSTICSSTKLSTLVLSHNSLIDSKTLQLELFSKLTVLDLSINRLEDFPVEICKLVHLQFLDLSGNPLKSLPVELGSLINLKYLILWYTNCTFPNKVLSKLKALRVLDLSIGHKAYNLDIFPTIEKDLQLLSHFQALGIIISSKLAFSRFSQTVSVPVIRWFDVCKYNESCLSFSSCFFENSHLQSNIVSIHISHSDDIECVKFENASENQSICHLGRLEHLFFRWMRNMKEVIWKGLDPKDVFPRLQILKFNFCPSLTSISWVVNLPCIRMLAVRHCTSIKQLIRIDELKDSGIHMSQLCFPFLTEMDLRYGDELEIISDLMISFPALEYLLVDNCDKLKNLPFKPSNHPRKLKLIKGSQEWWNNIELEDDSYRFSLQPFFEKLSSSPWFENSAESELTRASRNGLGGGRAEFSRVGTESEWKVKLRANLVEIGKNWMRTTNSTQIPSLIVTVSAHKLAKN